MKVVVDSSAWSLALRRAPTRPDAISAEVAELAREGRAALLGIVRQELLSGIRDSRQFGELRQRLRAFPDLELQIEDYETAAAYFNDCRAKGIQGTTVDFLICAAAARREFAILTTDEDFVRYARILPVKLHQPRQ